MFSLCSRGNRQSSRQEVSNRNAFASESIGPLTEGIRGIRNGWFKRTIRGVVLGTVIALGMGISMQGCNDKAKIVQTTPKTRTFGATTGEDGKAVFEVGEKRYVLTMTDFSTGRVVAGLNAVLFLKGDEGFFLVVDSNGVYIPRIISIMNTINQNIGVSRQGSSVDTVEWNYYTVPASFVGQLLANKYLECGDHCGVSQGRVPPRMPYDEQFFRDYLRYQTTVTLAELKNPASSFLIDETGQRLLEKAMAFLGHKIPEKASKTGSILSFVAIVGEMGWGQYYDTFHCFKDADRFEVYKLVLRDVPFVFTNPVFFVFPERAPESWDMPTGLVYGTVSEQVSENKIPSIVSIFNSRGLPGAVPEFTGPSGEYEFGVGACEGKNTYQLAVCPALTCHPRTTTDQFTVTPNDLYQFDFELKNQCREGNCFKLVDDLWTPADSSISIHNGIVVYAENYASDNIFYVDIHIGEIQRIPAHGIWPKIWNNKIVYSSTLYRVVGNSDVNILLYDISTGNSKVIGHGHLPSISDGKAGYPSRSTPGFNIYDLNTQTTTQIAYPQNVDLSHYNDPQLFESGIAMQNVDGVILFYDFETESWRTIETGVPQISSSTFSCQGTKCIFQSRENNTLYWTNLSTGETKEIYGLYRLLSDYISPLQSVWGDYAVFPICNPFISGCDLGVYNFTTSETTILTSNHRGVAFPVIHERDVVYVILKYPNETELYHCVIPSPE